MSIEQIKLDFNKAQHVLEDFISDPQTWIRLEQAGDLLVECLNSGGKIISCGNGGSMCDAMHFAEELTGRYCEDRKPLPAFAINDPSHITCVGNDVGFEQIFSRAVEALGKPGDVLLAISTSGKSQDVIHAIESARATGMKTIGLTGPGSDTMSNLCDVVVTVPFSGYSDRIQEIHMLILHAMVHYIEINLIEKKSCNDKS
jgi:D-sedoheptulose 7-phosphate isomerase